MQVIDRTQRGIPPLQSGEEAESLERTIIDAIEGDVNDAGGRTAVAAPP